MTVPLALAGVACARSSGPPHRLVSQGASGSFDFAVSADGSPAHIRVWYEAPSDGLATAPILFVMAGRQRNAREYRDQWGPLGREHGVLVVVPEFSTALFPGLTYNLGGVVDPSDAPIPEEDSAFAVIEPLFDAITADVGSSTATYFLYGHSAGAQFVHRFVLFQHPNRVAKAIVANAGWYTVPDLEIAFPYGVDESPATTESIIRALGTPLIVLLGEDDDDPKTDGLRTTAGAMRQGKHRLERGKYFFASGRDAADRFGVPFRWRALIVPDAGHSNEAMAPAAAALLFD